MTKSTTNAAVAAATFEVGIKRNSLGLGFSIMGGPEAPHPYTNLIRIKKVFPLQPAWECGGLRPGDVILQVDNSSLVSLTLRQALDVLRTSQPLTRLTVFRPPENHLETMFLNRGIESGSGSRDHPVNRSYSCNISGQDRADLSASSALGPTSIGIVPCSPNVIETGSSSRINNPDQIDGSVSGGTGCELDDSVQSFGQQCRPVFVDDASSEERDGFCNSQSNRTWTYGQNSSWSNSSWAAVNSSCQSADDKQQKKQSVTSMEFDLLASVPTHQVMGEFTVRLNKVNGSLGFALCQSDDATVLRHTVKALVKEPAISDGRIRPGDKLIAANGVDCSNMTHAELIAFLRKSPREVELKLYRDASRSQTPISPPPTTAAELFAGAAAATQSHPNLPSFLRSSVTSSSSSGGSSSSNASSQPHQKRLLRVEAKEMVRSLQASRTSLDRSGSAGNVAASGMTAAAASGNSSRGRFDANSSRNGSNASSSAGGSAAGRIRRLGGRPYSPKSPLTVLSTSVPTSGTLSSINSGNTKHPLLLREIHSFDADGVAINDVTEDDEEPTVESPMTPSCGGHLMTSSPYEVVTSSSSLEDRMERHLRIEELPPTPPILDDHPAGSSPALNNVNYLVTPPGNFQNNQNKCNLDDEGDSDLTAGGEPGGKPVPLPRPRNLDLLAKNNKRTHHYVFQMQNK